MNICGVLVHIVPDQTEAVAAAISSIPGAEVHEIQDHGRLIVTVEDTAEAAAIDGLSSIHKLPGVVAAALVYHHFESGHEDTGAHVIMEA
ncbi:MAG: chaperone NapD [Alphaproteobacteria bacterium]|nr:chaperone NapD [Alphaproteobacteria bacterium]